MEECYYNGILHNDKLLFKDSQEYLDTIQLLADCDNFKEIRFVGDVIRTTMLKEGVERYSVIDITKKHKRFTVHLLYFSVEENIIEFGDNIDTFSIKIPNKIKDAVEIELGNIFSLSQEATLWLENNNIKHTKKYNEITFILENGSTETTAYL